MNCMSAQSAVLLLQMLSSLLIYLLTIHPSEVYFTFLCSAEPVLDAFLALKPEYSGITKSDEFQIISGSDCACWNSSSKYLKQSNVLWSLIFGNCWFFYSQVTYFLNIGYSTFFKSYFPCRSISNIAHTGASFRACYRLSL